MFPQVHPLTDLALLFLRIMLAIIFVQSGSGMLKDPAAEAKDLGYSRTFTVFLGAAEVLGGLAVALGILIQVAAAGLMVIGLGPSTRAFSSGTRSFQFPRPGVTTCSC